MQNILKGTFALILLFSVSSFATESKIDSSLARLIEKHKLSPLSKSKKRDSNIVNLGRKLFSDAKLSGNYNISCMTCHHPAFGTSDALAFSIGEGGERPGTFRKQFSGKVIRRNSPALYNLGYDDLKFMFWDGRVSYSPSSKTYRTPEPLLNGQRPIRSDVTKVFNGALSAQVIFPLTSHEEMAGEPGTNSIADGKTNFEKWDRIVARLKSDRDYLKLFSKAFPNQKINIGHVGRSLADFITENFNYYDTPYDRYLKGDTKALSLAEKRGMKLFLEKGKCVECHKGRHLGGMTFDSSGTPELYATGHPIDFGLKETTKRNRDSYKFLTRTLRNIAFSAPYMHNGSLKDLRAVIDHYSDVQNSLYNYEVPEGFQDFYKERLLVDNDASRNARRFSLISEAAVKFGIKFTEQEKKDLEIFLKRSLTDYKLLRDLK